jgi:hypothetical protein
MSRKTPSPRRFEFYRRKDSAEVARWGLVFEKGG